MAHAERSGIILQFLSKIDNARTKNVHQKTMVFRKTYGMEGNVENPEVVFDQEGGRTELHHRYESGRVWLRPDGKAVGASWNSIVHTYNPQGELIQRRRMRKYPSGYHCIGRMEAIYQHIWMDIDGEKYFDRVVDEYGNGDLTPREGPKIVGSMREVVQTYKKNE